MSSINRIMSAVKEYRGIEVFNPWRDVDPDHDASDHAPRHRRENLEHYLSQRIKTARWLLIAEAAGFRGAKFSGIAMTCERQIATSALPNKRTSKNDIALSRTDQQSGVLEPTAMIVMRAMLKAQADPREIVLWNTFAWHPHKPGNRLTNRTPRPSEVEDGLSMLKKMMSLFPKTRLIAIGKTSQRTLNDSLGIQTPAVRHPANGGATEFTRGIIELMRKY